MDRDLVALLGFVGMFALMAVRVPIGIAMGIAGVCGFAALSGWKAGLNLLANVPLSVVTDYNLSVIPMFILMGAFASRGGMSRELFAAGRAWLGHLRGGLAMASVAACGGFAAINGSSVATAATMAQVALPEMRRAGYHPGLSAGLIAAGGTLGIMIPPSVIFVLYGIMTETDIKKLFAAGVVPGLLAVALYFVVVQVISRMRPERCRAASCTPGRSAGPACAGCGPWCCCSCSCSVASMAACSRSKKAPASAPSARC